MVFEMQTRKKYQGLIPSIKASPRPVAGYQATDPSRAREITAGRLNRTLIGMKQRESKRWR